MLSGCWYLNGSLLLLLLLLFSSFLYSLWKKSGDMFDFMHHDAFNWFFVFFFLLFANYKTKGNICNDHDIILSLISSIWKWRDRYDGACDVHTDDEFIGQMRNFCSMCNILISIVSRLFRMFRLLLIDFGATQIRFFETFETTNLIPKPISNYTEKFNQIIEHFPSRVDHFVQFQTNLKQRKRIVRE